MSVVIIPAYKPDKKLIEITDKLWTYGFRIVVVDDGSGEDYFDIFNQISDICILLRHEENRGKGAAIKTGLDYVNREIWGSTLIGVMGCDGQHLPEDLMKLFIHGENSEQLMVLGVRQVGFSSFVLDYLLFAFFMICLPHTAMFVLGANILARLVSAFYNYCMNCYFVFHKKKRLEQQCSILNWRPLSWS